MKTYKYKEILKFHYLFFPMYMYVFPEDISPSLKNCIF